MSDPNSQTLRRRQIVTVAAATLMVGAIGYWIIFARDQDPVRAYEQQDPIDARQTMTELSRQPVAERDLTEIFEQRLARLENQANDADERTAALETEHAQVRERLARAEADNEEIMTEASAMLEELAGQLAQARAESQTREAGPPTPTSRGPDGSVPSGQSSRAWSDDPFRPAGVVEASSSAEGPPALQDSAQTSRSRALQSVSFDAVGDDASSEIRPAVIRDAERYVPPNSYAPARVLVGVDAATGTSFGADPKPVMFRITGAAVSVVEGDEHIETDLTGCVVNGAAYGELSSEKVYVRLQRMTCPLNDGSGRVTESEVEGFVAHAGKAGVRGRVISREGDLAERALIAGTLQGLGSSFSRVGSASSLGGLSSVTGGEPPTSEEIAISSIGGGVESAASTLSQYYIERAEQYQPVIEMPTGIDVEIVFLSGVVVR